MSTGLCLPSHFSTDKLYCYYTNPYLNQILRVGDRISLGPSTYPGFIGIIESVLVSSVNPYWITLASTLENVFDIDDEVNGIGSVLAAGWNLGGRNGSAFSPTNIWGADHSLSYSNSEPMIDVDDTDWKRFWGGYDNKYRQYMCWITGDGIGQTATSAKLYRNYGNVLLGNTYYRFGYMGKGAVGDRARVVVNDGSSDFLTSTPTFTNANSWFAHDSSPAICTSSPSACTITIFRENTPTTNCRWMIDNIYLEHAKFTSDNANGVYTFTEIPTMGSEKVEPVAELQMKNERAPSGRNFRNQSSGTGDKVEKFIISMQFDNADIAFYRNLQILQDWQNSGNLLILHPTSILREQLKPSIYGTMTITGFSKNHWDKSKTSFTFIFEEE
jgi:hypothetical protein